MTKLTLNPPTLFNSLQYGFSQIVTTTGSKTVHLSGQVAWNAQQEIVGVDDLAEQTRQTFRNIETALKAAGASMNDVASMRIYIVDRVMDQNECVSTVLLEWFTQETAPATTWIGVQSLARPEFLIEVEAVAVTNL